MTGIQKVWYDNGQLKCKFIIEDKKPNPLECYRKNGNPMECSRLNLILGADTKEQKEFYISEIKRDSTELYNLKNDS